MSNIRNHDGEVIDTTPLERLKHFYEIAEKKGLKLTTRGLYLTLWGRFNELFWPGELSFSMEDANPLFSSSWETVTKHLAILARAGVIGYEIGTKKGQKSKLWLLPRSEKEGRHLGTKNSDLNPEIGAKNSDLFGEKFRPKSEFLPTHFKDINKTRGADASSAPFTDVKSAELRDVLDAFKEMREKSKKPLTVRAEKMLLKKLTGLTDNIEEQVKIVEQSVMNSWSGFYPLKSEPQKALTGGKDADVFIGTTYG